MASKKEDPQKKEKEDILHWLKTIGRNTAWLASYIGKTENTVKGILYGKKKLTQENAKKIENVKTTVSSIMDRLNIETIPDDHPLAKINPAFNPFPFSNEYADSPSPCTFYLSQEVYDALTLHNGWNNYKSKEALSDAINESLVSLLKEDLKSLRERKAIVHPLNLHYFKKEFCDSLFDEGEDTDPEVLRHQMNWLDSQYYDYVIVPEDVYKYANTACHSLNEEYQKTHRTEDDIYSLPNPYSYTDDYINSLLVKIMLSDKDKDLDEFLAD